MKSHLGDAIILDHGYCGAGGIDNAKLNEHELTSS